MPDNKSRYDELLNKEQHARLDELMTKQQRAGLTPDECAELAAIRDQLLQRAAVTRPASEAPTVRPEQVKARRSGREEGESAARAIRESLMRINESELSESEHTRALESFWREIKVELPAPNEVSGDLFAIAQPMTVGEALNWEAKTAMPFGKFVEQPIERVPIPYLRAIAENTEQEDFKRDLRRYLAFKTSGD